MQPSVTIIGPDGPRKHKTKEYFHREKKLLRLFGLDLNGNESMGYHVYSFLLLGVANFAYPWLSLREVLTQDFSVISGMLLYQFSTCASLAKTIVLWWNRVKIGNVLAKLEQEPFTPNLKRGGVMETKLVNQCLRVTRIQTGLYWICAAVSVAGVVVFTIITRLRSSDYHDWQFPYGPLTFINNTYSPNFEIISTYQSFCIICIGVHFTTIDLIIAAVLAHISFQFKILQNNLKSLVERSLQKVEKDLDYRPAQEGNLVPWKYLKESVKEAVHHHLAIIDLSHELEVVFSNLLLFVYLGTLGMLCFLVYHASMATNETVTLIRSVGEMSAVFFQILTVCYWGEEVMHDSQLVGPAAYGADFVGTDPKFQKALVLVMRRSLNPTGLTAGSFTGVCLSTFTWILRSSYSMFMVLRSNN